MGFKPFEQKGIPIERQFRNWTELNVPPYRKGDVDPYTRTRVILMNGIEVEAAFFGHNFLRHAVDPELRRNLTLMRRIEQQQQKAVNWLAPQDESNLEVTIGYEQVAVDLTAWLAQTEPDTYIKAVLDFGLLEDFDHLYRYANLLEVSEGRKAEVNLGMMTEVMPGRPTVNEHRHPFDDVRRPFDAKKAKPITQLHVMTIVAAEQQTMNFYMNVGNRAPTPEARGLYLEIAQIEEQHVTQYGSLLDPKATWFEMLALHEYNEVYLYHSFYEKENDPKIKAIWRTHLEQEVEHLRIAGELLMKYDKKDIRMLLPEELPEPVIFQPNKQYVRDVLAKQVDFTAQETEFRPVEGLPKDARYFKYQNAVNGNGFIPSQAVIEQHIGKFGQDYRFESEGPSPVQRFRERKVAVR